MSNKDTITQLKDILCFYEDAARLKTPITVQDSEVQTIKEAVSALEANEWQPLPQPPEDQGS